VYRFDRYGQDLADTGQVSSTTGARNPGRFRGAINLGKATPPLYEMGARLYAPSMAAWTSLDTYPGSAQDPASMDRYLYAQGNPTTLIDPTGHKAVLDYGTYVTPVFGKPGASSSSDGTSATGTSCSSSGTCTSPDDEHHPPSPTAPAGPDCQATGTCQVVDYDAWMRGAIARGDGYYAECLRGSAWGWSECSRLAQQAAFDPYAETGPFDLHGWLDMAGFTPVFGAVPDGINAVRYLSEGDLVNGIASGVSAIPGLGDLVGGGKLVVKHGDEVIDAVAGAGARADNVAPLVKLPDALAVGRNADTGVYVYLGIDKVTKKPIYAGITNDYLRRQAEHGTRFERLDALNEASLLTRGQARAVEQALILRAGGTRSTGGIHQNIRNSISPSHQWYNDAVAWGEQWLRTNGYPP
jgi:RHS repeat-associated protein